MTVTPENASAALAFVAPPADAEHIEDWIDETGDGKTWGRFIRGTRRAAGRVHIDLCGWQAADGTVERHVAVFAPDADLDAATARKLATAVLDAADQLDRLAAIERAA